MSDGDDEDIDSGWDAEDEDAPVTRAVDSRRLLAEVQARLAQAAKPNSEEAPISEAPSTRRATEDEVTVMRARAAGSAIRLGGRRNTPVVAAPEEFDRQVYTRPTPPAPRPAAATAPPPSPPKTAAPGARAGMRIPNEGTKQAFQTSRKKTAVNHQAVRDTEAPQGRISAPEVDLDLGLDLDAAFADGADSIPPNASEPHAADQHSAATRPPPAAPEAEEVSSFELPPLRQLPVPPSGDDFDDLPIDEVLRSVRPSAPAVVASSPIIARLRIPKIEDELASTVEAPQITADVLRALSNSELPATQASPELIPLEPREDDPAPVSIQIDVGGSHEIDVEEVSLSEDELAAIEMDADEDPELVPIRERFERGDFMGAARRAEALLATKPDSSTAQSYLMSANEALAQLYLDKLGGGEQVLRVAMAPDEIQGLSLDHRSGFLFSLIDGMACIDDILDMATMPRIDVLRLLYEMREQGVVGVA